VFGYDAFVHTTKEKRNKLDNNTVKCIFIYYKDVMKGYKIWDLLLRKTMYNQDVIFREVRVTSKSEGVQMDE
jgi:hypothetical protein